MKGPLPTLTVVMEAFTTFVIATAASRLPKYVMAPFLASSARKGAITYFK